MRKITDYFKDPLHTYSLEQVFSVAYGAGYKDGMRLQVTREVLLPELESRYKDYVKDEPVLSEQFREGFEAGYKEALK